MRIDNTSGLAHSIQVIDFTGEYISEAEYSATETAQPIIELSLYEEQSFVNTIGDRLAAIRKKSHSELGEAWARLAQM